MAAQWCPCLSRGNNVTSIKGCHEKHLVHSRRQTTLLLTAVFKMSSELHLHVTLPVLHLHVSLCVGCSYLLSHSLLDTYYSPRQAGYDFGLHEDMCILDVKTKLEQLSNLRASPRRRTTDACSRTQAGRAGCAQSSALLGVCFQALS